MFPSKKDDHGQDSVPDPDKAKGTPGEDGGSGGELSQGPNSFDYTETSVGGADSVYGTPDATPSTVLGDDEVPETPSAS